MKQNSGRKPSRVTWMIGGAALGALAMYLSDPNQGRRRRAEASDKLRSVANKTGSTFTVASRDLGNRMQGIRAQVSQMIPLRGASDIQPDDRMLEARVRQKIGRIVSHSRAIEVTAQEGTIVLSGPILATEKQGLVEAVRSVPGVSSVQDNMQVHESAEGVPSLQGGGTLGSSSVKGSWTPAMRAIAALGGGALSAYGLSGKRGSVKTLAATAGLAIMTRSVVNVPLKHMVGMSENEHAITLEKTIHIEAPPEAVFDLWSKYENFPQFMSNVRKVHDMGNGRSHWVVVGPGGARVEWDAELTESRRPSVLSWRSVPDSMVDNSGAIHFEPDGDGTRVSVRMSYSPPAGVLGQVVASLFGSDPKQQMDEDLARMKTFVESHASTQAAAKMEQMPSAATTGSSALH